MQYFVNAETSFEIGRLVYGATHEVVSKVVHEASCEDVYRLVDCAVHRRARWVMRAPTHDAVRHALRAISTRKSLLCTPT